MQDMYNSQPAGAMPFSSHRATLMILGRDLQMRIEAFAGGLLGCYSDRDWSLRSPSHHQLHGQSELAAIACTTSPR